MDHKFMHSDVKDSLTVIPNMWLQLLLPKLVQSVIMFGRQLFFYTGLDSIFSKINEFIM